MPDNGGGWFAYTPIDGAPRPGATPNARPGTIGGDPGEVQRLQLGDLGRLARRWQRRVVATAREEERIGFDTILRDHLGGDLETLDVLTETWPTYEHVNVQAGLDAWLAEPGRSHEILGVVGQRHHDFGLADLMRPGAYRQHGPQPGNVARINLPTGPDGASSACVECAVYLVTEGDDVAALLVRGGAGDGMGRRAQASVEIAAGRRDYAETIAARLREQALTHNVYRGHVVSFDGDMFGERSTVLSFHHRTPLSAEQLILPEPTRAAIERQVIGVAAHRDVLLAAGQHLKRGLLLYGPPGVGKTHTVRYLVGRLTGSTVVLLSGDSLHLIGAACSVARSLQPAVIVIEDVDLIAEDRGRHPGQHPLLFQLLNEMDGLDDDADVLFILTTNRADVLEPALAQRPGRVDQAVLIEHPDLDDRRRLFELYRGGLDLEVDPARLDAALARIDGVTASFLKELLRRAALIAAEAGTDASPAGPDDSPPRLTVTADHLDEALTELLDTRNAMTRTLLGGRAAGSGTPIPDAPSPPQD